MKINEMGGEFALIDQISTIIPAEHADLIAGIGDDAAVIRTSPEPAPYLLVTTDILVQDRHFSSEWAGPEQIGIKAAECNISDIAAMGGRPSWMFISLVLTKDTDTAWVQKLYRGISASCRRYGIIVAGGDTTLGSVNTINITLFGTVCQDHLCLRSHAKPKDHLFVTGPLGASAAALRLLEQGQSPSDSLLEKHLAPTCRMDVSEAIAPLANAMIDISDGLASEIRHLCRQSNVDARIHAQAIPIQDDVRAVAKMLQIDAIDFALDGGEDYELLFSIAEDNLSALSETKLTVYQVGVVTEKKQGPLLVTPNGKFPLTGGFDHFR